MKSLHPFQNRLIKQAALNFSLIIFALFCLFDTKAQTVSGIVKDRHTLEELKYATIGVVGKDIGTAADERGRFTINLGKALDKDSLKISFIGYKSYYISIGTLKDKSHANSQLLAYLDREAYALKELTISSGKPRKYDLGFGLRVPRFVECYKSDISNELGSFYTTNKTLFLTQISLKVRNCSFDSAIFSANIYKVNPDSSLTSIMVKPVLSVIRKTPKSNEVVFDLKGCLKEKLTNSYAVCISLVAVAGEGTLRLPIYYGTGYWRKLCESKLERLPVKIGLSAKGYVR